MHYFQGSLYYDLDQPLVYVTFNSFLLKFLMLMINNGLEMFQIKHWRLLWCKPTLFDYVVLLYLIQSETINFTSSNILTHVSLEDLKILVLISRNWRWTDNGQGIHIMILTVFSSTSCHLVGRNEVAELP